MIVERAEEALHRVFEEVEQVGEDDVVGGGAGSGSEMNWSVGVRVSPAAASRRAQRGRVEAERLAGHQLAGFDVANVERLQRMLDDDALANRLSGVVWSSASSSSASGTAGGRG